MVLWKISIEYPENREYHGINLGSTTGGKFYDQQRAERKRFTIPL
jgi:hypothetical protein